MAHLNLRNERFNTLFLATAAILVFQACADDDALMTDMETTGACGGHGELHGDHCDCDDGYVRDAADETLCIEEPEGLTYRPGRLLVAEGSKGGVRVIDLVEGEVIASLTTMGPARLYPSSNGLRGFAVEGTANAVEAIEPGLRYISHGDHYDRDESDPSVLDEVVVSCERPVHFVSHDGESAAFCDGDGMLHVFEDESSDFDVSTFDSGRPHHGVGMVAFDHILLSKPNPDDEEDALPIGVRVLHRDGEEEESFDACLGLHGEAATHHHACFGCSDGVMCIEEGESGLAMVKIDNPEGSEEGLRVGTLVGGHDALVGNFGEDLVRVDPEAGTLTPIALGEAYLSFALTHDDEFLLVLTDAGELRKVHLDDGDTEASAMVFPAFEREAGHGQLRPAMVASDDYVYVVDPREPEVYEFDLKTLQLTPRTLKLPPGEYSSLALVALEPEDAH